MGNYEPSPSAVFRQIDDQIIALNLETGEYFTMNEMAARMWTVLTETGSLEATVEVIISEFEVSAEEAGKDLEGLIAELRAQGLLAGD
jgi:glycerophosphoryl diester phosphodiesterase